MGVNEELVKRLRAHDLGVSPSWTSNHARHEWEDQADSLLKEAANLIDRLARERDEAWRNAREQLVQNNAMVLKYYVALDERDEARRALEDIVGMISYCAGCPTEPDSLPQMIKAHALRAISTGEG